MAAIVQNQRFAQATEKTIQYLKIGAKNQNTSKSTAFWLNVWATWCHEKQLTQEMEKIEAGELNILLERFYAEVKTKNGDDYEPDSLRVMMAAFDRNLKDKGYKHSIIRDREFSSSKLVLEGKARLLRQDGRGKRPNKARQLTQQEEEVLWEGNKLGCTNPESLIHSMWWLLTQHFGLRGRQEHHDMKMQDFRFGRADNGKEFVEFAEGPTKTRPGGLSTKSRDFLPRMFETGGERCPVRLFKEYKSRRPSDLQSQGPFYLSINHKRKPNNQIWYTVQAMGVNKINAIMKTLVEGTALETSGKRFTNHSARKTLVGKLKKARVERAGIAKITGHRNIQSIDDYDEGDEEEQCELSMAISSRNNSSAREIVPVSEFPNWQINSPIFNEAVSLDSHGPSTSMLHFPRHQSGNNQVLQRFPSVAGFSNSQSSNAALTLGSQAQVNTFNGCTVAFNFNKSPISPVVIPSRKRRYTIESDSESD